MADKVDGVHVTHTSGVAEICLNKPQTRNAMSPEIRGAIVDLLDEWRDDPSVRLAVICGKGGSFIAGGDLTSFAKTLTLTPEERQKNFETRVKAGSELIKKIITFPKPIISVIEGSAAGAGIGIALASDFVIATRASTFTFAHIKAGLGLDIGLSYFLPRVAGTLAAKKLAMLGSRISAEELDALGGVTYLVEEAEVTATKDKLIASLLANPAPALAAIKQQLNQSLSYDLDEQLELEAKLVGQTAASEEFKARIEAFMSKKKAS